MQEREVSQTRDKFLEAIAVKPGDRLQLAQAIRQLENKVVEVTHLLNRQSSLPQEVRFQLKDDLDYYQQLLTQKRTWLQQASEA